MPADVARIPVEGTTIAYATTVGGSYTSIPNVEGVTPSNPEYERVDVWGLGSTVKLSRPGLIPEPGQLVFRMRWDPSGTVSLALRAARLANTIYFYKITYEGDGLTNSAFETVPGWIVSIETDELTEENNLMATITIQCTELPTFTAGT